MRLCIIFGVQVKLHIFNIFKHFLIYVPFPFQITMYDEVLLPLAQIIFFIFPRNIVHVAK